MPDRNQRPSPWRGLWARLRRRPDREQLAERQRVDGQLDQLEARQAAQQRTLELLQLEADIWRDRGLNSL